MREIKFRAWDKKGKVWLEWGSFDLFQMLKNDRYVVVQYTGLKDKKGKEIYEGDILAFIFPNNSNKGIAPIVWEYGCWNVTDFKNEAGSNNIYNLYPTTDCEVIGNIKENPELLN